MRCFNLGRRFAALGDESSDRVTFGASQLTPTNKVFTRNNGHEVSTVTSMAISHYDSIIVAGGAVNYMVVAFADFGITPNVASLATSSISPRLAVLGQRL